MPLWTLAVRSVAYYARSHRGTFVGAGVAAAVLTGALVVGDSVRESLRWLALLRLGRADLAIASGDRTFRHALANEVGKKIQGKSAAALQLPAVAIATETASRANQVIVFGVDSNWWGMAHAPFSAEVAPDAVWLNQSLAQQLKVKVEDSIVLRVRKPAALSQDAPLSPEEDNSVALRLRVERILVPEQGGNFALQGSQLPPMNAFVSWEMLQARTGATNRANLMLVGPASIDASGLNSAIKETWRLADAELSLVSLTNAAGYEIRSTRVFMDALIRDAAFAVHTNVSPVLTYFVNEIRVGTNSTPYSMISAVEEPVVEEPMGYADIILNEWLANDLQAKAGDRVELKFYVVGSMRALEEKSAIWHVKQIVPIAGRAADPSLMPDFPGLTDAENCRDWDTGFPINTDAIRDKDEQYWDQWRGTPKAFIQYGSGVRWWGNRFGDLTALRFYSERTGPMTASEIEKGLLSKIEPADVGLAAIPVRSIAQRSSTEGQDFGQLFLGFSFFIMLSALLLMSLLFRFGIEQRRVETGTLLALGFRPGLVRRRLLLEGAGLAVIGSALGVVAGAVYAQLMLLGLSTIWKSAVAGSSLILSVNLKTLGVSFVASIVVAVITIWWALRQEGKTAAHELLQPTGGGEAENFALLGKRRKRSLVICLVLIALAMLCMISAPRGSSSQAGLFFGAGALLLGAGLAFFGFYIRGLLTGAPPEFLQASALGVRNVARRFSRSRAIIALLASGTFIVAAIGAFRLETESDFSNRRSGTGGFALIGESSLPVVQDLNSISGQEAYGLNAAAMSNVSIVPFRVRAGDDASCLNLNLPIRPRLLGVDPKALVSRQAFTFASSLAVPEGASPWSLLEMTNLPAGVIPAIGDAASIQWAMRKKVGDTIEYTDERGRTFELKIVGAVANSILQGNLVISEKNYISAFPNESGYRMFLIETASNQVDTTSEMLGRALQDVGLQLTRSSDRIAAYNEVQNTYLNTFQVLGGLGLLIGSIGLGIVVLRNVLERRNELALLQAVGFRRGMIQKQIVSEHAFLLVSGLLLGILCALLAILPNLLASNRQLPPFSLYVTLIGILLFGFVATWIAARIALKGELLNALRNE
ncbi:MAG: ABC transporter permease [Verrucomicrobiota bacterium]|nr:ABC transporter permease [Verrucomicrobiota bacterium]